MLSDRTPKGDTRGTPDAPEHWAEVLHAHVPTIRRITQMIARKALMPPEDRDELLSLVFLKLVSNDYAAIRAFQGRGSLPAYLSVVIRRVALDFWISRQGKVRPSARLRREGAGAMALDALMHTRGIDFDEACRQLESRGVTGLAKHRLCEVVGSRVRRRFVALDDIAELPSASSGPLQALQDIEARKGRRLTSRELRRALRHLSPEDRRLLVLRFRDGCTLATIARRFDLDQKGLYRHFNRCLSALRKTLEERGLDATTVLAQIGHPASEPAPVVNIRHAPELRQHQPSPVPFGRVTPLSRLDGPGAAA